MAETGLVEPAPETFAQWLRSHAHSPFTSQMLGCADELDRLTISLSSKEAENTELRAQASNRLTEIIRIAKQRDALEQQVAGLQAGLKRLADPTDMATGNDDTDAHEILARMAYAKAALSLSVSGETGIGSSAALPLSPELRAQPKDVSDWPPTACRHPSCEQCEGAYRALERRLSDESGWVIEHRRSPAYEPEYWAGNGWSKDNLRAIRFARQEDAENTRAGFDEDDPLPDEQPHRVAEHGWG